MKRLISIAIGLAMVLSASAPANATAVRFNDIPMPEDVQTYLYNQCMAEGISFDLMVALIDHESRFNPVAISRTGDQGLCQINVEAQSERMEEMGVTDIMDPYQNIDVSLDILSDLYGKYGDDTNVVLMAYNCGERGARELWNQGIWETSYTLSIMREADRTDYAGRIAEEVLKA